MKAHVLTAYGDTTQFAIQDIPTPEVGDGQLRIRIKAIGINPLETKIRHGWLQEMIPLTFPAILGNEIAGTIDQVGEGVDGYAPGDHVVGFTDGGSYAEYTVTRAITVAPIPEGLSFERAVTLPVAAETSLRALAPLAIQPGETVVINGAAGAVGSAAVQRLVRDGVTVIGTASETNHEYLRGLGAIPVTYGEGVVDRIRALAPDGIDAVFDVAGHGFAKYAIVLRGGPERIVTISDFEAGALGITIVASDPTTLTAETIGPVLALAASDEFATEIAATFDFSEIPAAQEYSEQGHLRGKIVVTGT